MYEGGEAMPVDKEKQIRRQNNYIKEKYDRITIALPKGAKERYQKHADKNGFQSITDMFVKLTEADIEQSENPLD
jgi:hypothetical protein